jgi:hypothetical protein
MQPQILEQKAMFYCWQLSECVLEKLYRSVLMTCLDSNPAKLFVRGEYTKTRTNRTIFLTDVAHQLQSWLHYKYRTRRICNKG